MKLALNLVIVLKYVLKYSTIVLGKFGLVGLRQFMPNQKPNPLVSVETQLG